MAPVRAATVVILLILLRVGSGGPAPAEAAPPPVGPLAERLLPGVEAAPPPDPLVFRFARLSEGGHQIDTTRVVVRAPGWNGAAVITLDPVGIRGGYLTGSLSVHNGALEPLYGVRLDFGLRVETIRGVDEAGRPEERVRSGAIESTTPLFLGDLARGADTPPIPFSIGPVGFREETISVEFQAALTGYELDGVISTADTLELPPPSRGEGLDDTPRRVRAGDLTQPARFSRCYCRVDSIVAMGADSRPLATPPKVRAGAALGGLNALVACDLDNQDQVFLIDRRFADDDSTGEALARISSFDVEGRFITAWGWGAPAVTQPGLPVGRIRDPEGLAVLSDGRVLVQQKARPQNRAEIMIFVPFPRRTTPAAPSAR